MSKTLFHTLLLITALLWLGCRSTSTSISAAMTDQDRADLKEILASSKQGEPTELDFSNPVHYRFYVNQLVHAGITREKYPQQYKVLDETREKHVRSGLTKVDRPVMLASTAAASSAPSPIQTLTSFGPNGATYQATVLSSVPNTPLVSQATISLFDSNQNPIGTPGFNQQSNNGADVQAATSATTTAGSTVSAVMTYFWQDHAGNAHHGTITAATALDPTNITNTAPMPAAGQTITKLCLGRTGTDCTYTPAGGSGSNVLMPVSGSVTFGSPISTSPTTPNFSLITMANPNAGSGGGCTISSTSNFFGDPNTVINGNTISWNLNPAQFQPANNCLAVNAPAIYTFTVGVTVSNLPVYTTITNAPNTPPLPSYLSIPGLSVYFSCLADGTEVELKDGRMKKIENVAAGDTVLTNRRGTAMRVHSTLKGTEEVPMIRFKTENGHELLLTDGHPVVTPGGVMLARLLKTGDRVITREGPSRIVSLGREMFGGHVWNLNVGDGQQVASRPDATTFFANGVLVGDNEMQFTYNNRQQRLDWQKNVEALPAEWRVDQQSYEASRREAGR
ncbi:MAG TPA: Hint domain-containing protein [Thermoanaerobaculia bacterium]|jgi:hypothetical protein|nr:Hint domain-containing protein [Thermoanaerobaculia bacterium]